jgi:DNA invertase Pin-like site-specific DNA recombinase
VEKRALAAGYVRVSSRAQDLQMQRETILKAATARGDELVWYQEKRSAKSIVRPELDRLRTDVRLGKVRKVYVYRLDRLCRSGIRDTLELVEQFRHYGCAIASLADPFDLSLPGPFADFAVAMIGWAAEMERAAIGERISTAIERARERGETWGRPPRYQPADESRIWALKAKGYSLRDIAQRVKLHRCTVARILQKSKNGQRSSQVAS